MSSRTFPSDPDGVCFIAEAGVNHNGDLERALELVDAAAEADVDAVKFQTFSADRLVVEDAPTASYQDEQTGETSQHDLLAQYELSDDEFEAIQNRCVERDVAFLSTPFDRESASLLADLGVSTFKVGSGEVTNHPFLEYLAGFGLPLIVSTGMSTLDEVRRAYATIRRVDSALPLVLLHCTSSYPADVADVNLRAMQTLDHQFPVPVGYSDHTTDVETPALATAAGALVVEKHFTLDRSLPGPDHEASLEPSELARAVTLARDAATARGSPDKRPVEAERETRRVARKSLHAARDLDAGETLVEDDVAIKRPNDGLSPTRYPEVLGAALVRPKALGAPITEEDVER